MKGKNGLDSVHRKKPLTTQGGCQPYRLGVRGFFRCFLRGVSRRRVLTAVSNPTTIPTIKKIVLTVFSAAHLLSEASYFPAPHLPAYNKILTQIISDRIERVFSFCLFPLPSSSRRGNSRICSFSHLSPRTRMFCSGQVTCPVIIDPFISFAHFPGQG
jgi:hypothetical protein